MEMSVLFLQLHPTLGKITTVLTMGQHLLHCFSYFPSSILFSQGIFRNECFYSTEKVPWHEIWANLMGQGFLGWFPCELLAWLLLGTCSLGWEPWQLAYIGTDEIVLGPFQDSEVQPGLEPLDTILFHLIYIILCSVFSHYCNLVHLSM